MRKLDPKYQNKEGDELSFSVSKLVGKKIADIEGYIGDPYGGGMSLILHRVVFEDGSSMFFWGEHDVAGLETYPGGATFLVDFEDLDVDDED